MVTCAWFHRGRVGGLIEHVQYEYHHCSSFLIEEISHVTTVPHCNRPHSLTQIAITCGDNKQCILIEMCLFRYLLAPSHKGDFGSVRALNLTVLNLTAWVGSDDLGYGPGSGFSFEPVQTSSLGTQPYAWLASTVLVQVTSTSGRCPRKTACDVRRHHARCEWLRVILRSDELCSSSVLENIIGWIV